MSSSILLLLILSTSLLVTYLSAPLASASTQPTGLVFRTWGGDKSDIGTGIAVDSSGNSYITGYTYSFGLPSSYSIPSLNLLKYGPGGILLWQRTWSGGVNLPTEGFGVAIDSSNESNIYVTGYTFAETTNLEYIILAKFDSSGSLLWAKSWGGNGSSYGKGVALDSSGNIYVTGYTSIPGGPTVILLKVSSAGSLIWQKTWRGQGGEYDSGDGIAVGLSGEVYVTGAACGSGSCAVPDEVLLLKFNSTGSLIWQKTWGGVTVGYGGGVALDSTGNIYVTGQTYVYNSGYHNVLILKFDSSGGLIWQETWGQGTTDDGGTGVALDSRGDIYLAGTVSGFHGYGNPNIMLLKLNSFGGLVSQNYWPGNNPDITSGIALDTSGNEFVTGAVADDLTNKPTPLNGTIGSPRGTPSNPSSTVGTPTISLGTPGGTLQVPAGAQSFPGGGDDEFLLEYGNGVLPSISFETNTGSGGITFNATEYTNGQSGNYSYAGFWASATPPAGYVFINWTETGGVVVESLTSYFTRVSITGSGFLRANFATTPGPPINLIATPGADNISLTWSAPSSDGGVPITSYQIFRVTPTGYTSLIRTWTGANSFTDTGLTPGITYHYYLKAVNGVGSSNQSSEVSGVPIAPRSPRAPGLPTIFTLSAALILIETTTVILGIVVVMAILLAIRRKRELVGNLPQTRNLFSTQRSHTMMIG